jgi:spermidine/putrescine ABC transporter ATP-binding subunit
MALRGSDAPRRKDAMVQSAAVEPAPAPTNSSAATGAVSLVDVSKRYGEHTVVDRLTLDIRAGEFLTLLGPSGCGKTTTLRMIAGFEEPDSGDIRISGVSVIGTPAYRRDVNTVFQAYALFPHLTVAENVAYGLQQKRVARAEVRDRVAAALDMARMREFADRKPTQLSGGQQQRVALARALVNRPAVLLLDEPLGALDRQLREEMQLELKLLQSELGITFVFVTHDQDEALSMSDRIAVLRDGRIEQLDDAATVYARPASAYVAGFVGQQNFLEGSVGADGRTVRTAHALIEPGPDSPGFADGTRVRAAIRPESIQLSSDAPTGDANRARGQVRSVSHLGEMLQFLVQLDDATSLLVRRPTPEAPAVDIGDPVWASWTPASVHVFPADAALPEPAEPRP